jgi:putative ABC transport system permease protein
VVVALVTGLIATLAGAAWPAVRGARMSPIRSLTGGAPPRRAMGRRRAVIGLAFFLPGLVGGGFFWFGTTSDSPLVGMAGALATMLLFLGMVRLAPFVVLPLVRLMARPLMAVMPAEGRLAADAAQANPGRTAATAATLLVALSVVVVNATIAQSFVGSVKSELDERFARDLTVQPLGYQEYGPPQAGLSSRLRRQIAALPETGAVASRRSVYVMEMPAGGSDGVLVGYEPSQYDEVDKVAYEGAPRAEVIAGLSAGGVVPAKPYAEDQGLEIGDRVRLRARPGCAKRRSWASPTRSTPAAGRCRCRSAPWPPSTASATTPSSSCEPPRRRSATRSPAASTR